MIPIEHEGNPIEHEGNPIEDEGNFRLSMKETSD